MKKAKACVVALAGFVTSVHAQNSVTLYGIADEGLQFTTPTADPANHGVKAYQLVDAGIEWGFKGVEELGGGMQAVFRLENGSGSTDSTSNLEFGRIAYLGLASKQYGTVTIGHDWDVVENYLGKFTANDTWGGPTFSHPLDNDNTNGDFGVDNGVKYTSPNYLGLQLGAMYGFSNSTAFADNRLYGLGLLYSKGPLSAAAAYEEINEPDSATNSTDGAVPSSAFLFTAHHQRILGVGATYLIGRSTVGVEYTNTGVFAPTGSTYIAIVGAPSALKFNNIEVNYRFNFAPDIWVGSMYTYTRANVEKDGPTKNLNWNQVALIADYLFSKRTDVYVTGSYQRVGGATTGTDLDQAYIVGSAGMSSNRNQTVARIDFRLKI